MLKMTPLISSRCYYLEHQWLKEYSQRYKGEWVALDGDVLLAHGDNASEVYHEAKSVSKEVLFLTLVLMGDELPFGEAVNEFSN